MILYHGTTFKRAKEILSDRIIKKDCARFFTEEENGDGYSTDGYIYLSNEITYALYFANCHHFVDKSNVLYVFRIDVPDNLILPDYDEMRYQDPTGSDRARYPDDISCSLQEFKTCRIQEDILFDVFAVDYIIVDRNDYESMGDIFENAGCNYEYVIKHYTRKQKQFINDLNWIRV